MSIDFKNPDYAAVMRERCERQARINAASAAKIEALKAYYAAHIAEFISDFGMTMDPRVAAKGRSPFMPFVLFPKQIDLVEFIVRKWRTGAPGIVVKSRDVGASWIAMAVSCSLCIFHKNMMIGVGSAKEIKLDRTGDPDSLFYKARQFMQYLPLQFRGSWAIDAHAPYMRMLFPDTVSSITGEAGDSIGRGGRKAIYFVDEAAHIERPALVDASLASTTDCRIDMSSVAGTANSFAEKAMGGKIERFDFAWQDDPRKDQAWYDKKAEELDPITLAQEIDRNFSASIEGIVIPSIWVTASVDAHIRLKIAPSGKRQGSLDVADTGIDKNAFAWRYGNCLEGAKSWTGKNSDIFATAEKAFMLCDELSLASFNFDNDGLGAGISGDARIINARRKADGLRAIAVESFRGSGEVLQPEKQMVPGRKNQDFFANLKAQSWWHLRFMFQQTWRASQGLSFDRSMVISIASGFPEISRLLLELSQPVYSINTAGKILIDKAPEGMASPNLADAVMMCFAPRKAVMRITAAALQAAEEVT
jgi:phage terminase large subunit